MSSYRDEQGVWRHKFRQSGLKTADLCLERYRLEDDPDNDTFDEETDAACVGTAVHTAIERVLGGAEPDVELFHEAFTEQMALPTFRWVKYTEKSARSFGAACFRHWLRDVRPTLSGTVHLERGFTVPLLSTRQRTIELSGTMDFCGDEHQVARLKDWKTSGRGPYEEWEYKRWAIQPTVYSYAAVYEGWVDPDPEGLVPFEFVVMHERGVQRFVVKRGPEHWDWLRDKANALATLIEAQLPVWPKNDEQVLCSPKWCPAWSQCKGAAQPSGF